MRKRRRSSATNRFPFECARLSCATRIFEIQNPVGASASTWGEEVADRYVHTGS